MPLWIPLSNCRIAFAGKGRSAFPSWNMPPRKSSQAVAILNPEHLFDQAEKLILSPPAGRPRQVDIRRAISAAYYGVFHATWRLRQISSLASQNEIQSCIRSCTEASITGGSVI